MVDPDGGGGGARPVQKIILAEMSSKVHHIKALDLH